MALYLCDLRQESSKELFQLHLNGGNWRSLESLYYAHESIIAKITFEVPRIMHVKVLSQKSHLKFHEFFVIFQIS